MCLSLILMKKYVDIGPSSFIIRNIIYKLVLRINCELIAKIFLLYLQKEYFRDYFIVIFI